MRAPSRRTSSAAWSRSISPSTRRACAASPCSSTRTQFALLACFARHPGRLLTHRAIVTEVWGDPDAAAADNLRVQISQLRRRIEQDPRHPQLIVTEPGLGYRFLDDRAGENQEP